MKSLDEKIEQIVWDALNMVGEKPVLHFVGESTTKKAVAAIKSTLLAEIEGRLPKRRIMVNPVPDSDEVVGYNLALKEVKQILEDLKK